MTSRLFSYLSTLTLPRRVRALQALASGALVLLPAAVHAQHADIPLSPAGRLRIGFVASFTSWDSRFGSRTDDGTLVEEVEPLGFDLADPEGRRPFPGVSELEASLRELLEDPSYAARLGVSRASVTSDQTRLPFRVDVGVFDWLTVGATVPLVKSRTELTFSFRGDSANLGLNPFVDQPGAVATFLTALLEARAAASARATDVCDASPGSAACMDARGLEDDVDGFVGLMLSAYQSSALFPVTGTPTGEALLDRVAAFDAELQAAGLGSIGAGVPLAGAPVSSAEDIDAIASSDAFGMAPPGKVPGLWELGDIELHAYARIMDGAVRDSAGAPARLRYRVGGGALVRLGTGRVDDPSVILDVGTGDGQTDVEGRLFADLARGRFGLWADVRYGVQLPTTLLRRIGPPGALLLPRDNLRAVEWTPGNYLDISLAPRIHLTTELAATLGYRFHRKGEDEYRSVPGPPVDPAPFRPGPAFADPSLLEGESEETVHALRGGMTFSTMDAWREGRTGFPFEVRFIVDAAVAGSGGLTPKTLRGEVGIRLYRRLWGG